MIWICGDTHGLQDIYKVQDYFEEFIVNTHVTKEDYLIILGDVAVSWDDGIHDERVREILHSLPCTVLWLDGNHENFDLLDELPITMWHGGKVQYITSDIIHLMRGQCYLINGKRIFVFGGANSVDQIYRIHGVDWWEKEMPASAEYEEGIMNLQNYEYKVDYILTHTCPRDIALRMTNDLRTGEEELQNYLQKIKEKTSFTHWYFGHWHQDIKIENITGVWYEIYQL